jgi:GTP-binding protein
MVPPPLRRTSKSRLPLRLQPFNLAYDNFLGRMAVARIYEGTSRGRAASVCQKADGEPRQAKS